MTDKAEKKMSMPELKKALDTCCQQGCDYDEAEGGLINHCDKCCRKIVKKLVGIYYERT